MKDNDGVLALLQDIKDILYGIALLLTGGLLCVAGILLGGFAILLSAIGFFVLLAGLNNAYQGYHHHTVEENRTERRFPCPLKLTNKTVLSF